VTSSAERGAASLTTERLDPLRLTMLAIANERMKVSVSEPEVRALLIGTGEAVGVYSLGCSPTAFHLTPGAYRRRGRFHAWRGGTTDGAIKRGARLEKTVDQSMSAACLGMGKLKPRKATKQRPSKEEKGPEQKQDNV
jgi:hypothetical protein